MGSLKKLRWAWHRSAPACFSILTWYYSLWKRRFPLLMQVPACCLLDWKKNLYLQSCLRLFGWLVQDKCDFMTSNTQFYAINLPTRFSQRKGWRWTYNKMFIWIMPKITIFVSILFQPFEMLIFNYIYKSWLVYFLNLSTVLKPS